ncbi:MAG: hypothetical protein AB7O70_15160 [Hyphomicrobiales bacterium]
MSDSAKALQILAAHLAKQDHTYRPDVYLLIEERAAPAIATWEKTIEPVSVDRSLPLTVAFIDLIPSANYEHPVQYAFIDEMSGNIEIVEATTPPNALTTDFRKVEIDIPASGQR